MALSLACYFSDEITAVAAWAGGLAWEVPVENHSTYSARGCQGGDAPLPVLIIHDPADPVVPYLEAAVNVYKFARANRCDIEACPALNRSVDILSQRRGLSGMFEREQP